MRLATLCLFVGCSGLKPSGTDTGLTDTETDADTDADADADTDADTDADADTDTDTDSDADTDPTPTGVYRHTITVDGSVADFDADETFTAGAGTTHLAWDATNLYVGLSHPDVGASAEHWIVITIGDGGPGSFTGIQHGTQQPALGFPATRVVRIKADDSFNSLLAWNGATWDETPFWLGTAGSSYVSNFTTDQAELALPLAALGITSSMRVHVAWVFEGVGFESTYAPTPSTSFVDGYDPDYGAWYAFDLGGAGAPTSYAPESVFVPVPTGDTGTPPAPTGDTGPGTPPIETADTGGVVLPTPTGDTGAPPPPPAWRFTATVDGDPSEWVGADTRFVTSGGTSTWLGWDDTQLYVAVNHPDIQAGGPLHWVLVYLGDGGPGANAGVLHGTQQPTLPFGATHLVRWKADDSFDSLETWDGVAWQSTPSWLGTAGSSKAEDNGLQTVELGVPLAGIGVADTLEVHVALVYEGAGYESTYAATPAGSIVDGSYDPDYATGWRFDRTSPLPPTAATPIP